MVLRIFGFKFLFFGLIFIIFSNQSFCQNLSKNKYGLNIIENKMEFKKTVLQNPEKQMVDLKNYIPNLAFDLKYCTANNFTHQQLYPKLKTTYLRKQAADSLKKVQEILNEQGLGLKIFDAYRPFSVTEKMWAIVPDDRYAANPKNGSGHNRGVAVDLTIINLKTNKELNMGTGFDNFSDTAHINFLNLPSEVLEHRQLLKSIMEKHGFVVLETEWWHFYLFNAKGFELMDMTFKMIK